MEPLSQTRIYPHSATGVLVPKFEQEKDFLTITKTSPKHHTKASRPSADEPAMSAFPPTTQTIPLPIHHFQFNKDSNNAILNTQTSYDPQHPENNRKPRPRK